MGSGLVADIDRAAGHLVIVGVLVAIAIVGGLTHQLVRLVGQRRVRRTDAERGAGGESSDGRASTPRPRETPGLEP